MPAPVATSIGASSTMVAGRVAAVEGGGVDEGLERRAGLAQRLGGAVEDARLVGEAALHGEHAAGLGVHRHEAALDRRDLAVGPVVEGAVLLDRLDEDDVADVPHVVRALGRAQPAAVGRGCRAQVGVGEGEEVAVLAARARPRRRCGRRPRRCERITAGCQPSMSRGTWVAESARAPARLARRGRSSPGRSAPPGRDRRVRPRSYFSSPSRSARAATACRSGSTVARMVRPPVKSSSSPSLAESWRRISSVK